MSSSSAEKEINVLVPLGPRIQSEINVALVEYFSKTITTPSTNVFFFSFNGTSENTKEVDKISKRLGFRIAPVSVSDDPRLKKKVVGVAGGSLDETFVPDFMPLDSKLRQRLHALKSGSNVKSVHVFELDPECGYSSAPACVLALCDGVFSSKESLLPGEHSQLNHDATFVPRPDFVLMGTHGKKLLERFVIGSVATNVLHNVDVPCIFYRHENDGEGKIGVKTESDAYKKYASEEPPQPQPLRNVVLLGLAGTQSSIDVVKFYVSKLARANDDCILAHVPMKSQTLRAKNIEESDVILNLETCKSIVEKYCEETKCGDRFRLRDCDIGKDIYKGTSETSPNKLDPREQLVEAAKGFGATMIIVGRSAFGDSGNVLAKMFYVGTLPLYLTQYASQPVCVYNPPRGKHAPKSYESA